MVLFWLFRMDVRQFVPLTVIVDRHDDSRPANKSGNKRCRTLLKHETGIWYRYWL